VASPKSAGVGETVIEEAEMADQTEQRGTSSSKSSVVALDDSKEPPRGASTTNIEEPATATDGRRDTTSTNTATGPSNESLTEPPRASTLPSPAVSAVQGREPLMVDVSSPAQTPVPNASANMIIAKAVDAENAERDRDEHGERAGRREASGESAQRDNQMQPAEPKISSIESDAGAGKSLPSHAATLAPTRHFRTVARSRVPEMRPAVDNRSARQGAAGVKGTSQLAFQNRPVATPLFGVGF